MGYCLLHTKDAELCIEEIAANIILVALALERTEEPAYVEMVYTAESAVTEI